MWGVGPAAEDDFYHTCYSTGTDRGQWSSLGWEPAAPRTGAQARGSPPNIKPTESLLTVEIPEEHPPPRMHEEVFIKGHCENESEYPSVVLWCQCKHLLVAVFTHALQLANQYQIDL